MKFRLFRFDPESGKTPFMQAVELDIDPAGKMLLDALLELKAQDDTLAFRRSCREGVCGSDAVNILSNHWRLKDYSMQCCPLFQALEHNKIQKN